MPMLCAQLDLIKEMGMEQVQLSEKLVYCNSESKPARIANLEFRNDKFRKVRMTYFDGGDAVQVFNTLWYPSYEYDAPLLGVDLISLGLQRVLTVIDFQPLHVSESYSNKHIDHLAPTRNKYPDLHGVLSGKIYDDTSFFSKQMLFGRFTDESKVESVVQPAFTDYLNTYVNMVSSMKADHDETAKAVVQSRQKAYDEYSALKDPAVGLFDAYFGKEWSNAFVHEFLFGLCERNEHKQTTPVHNFKFDAQGQVGVSTGASSQFRFSAQT
jgi:15,16-dihydrobiliverdin:ferredoxin oxidoreductase